MSFETWTTVVIVVGVAALGGYAALVQRRYFAQLRERLKGDPDVGVVDDPGIPLTLHTRRPRRTARLRPRRDDDDSARPEWEFATEAHRVWRRTTLKLWSNKALGGRFRVFEGLNAPLTDAALAARVALGGAQPDVVRGLVAVPAVRDALIRLVDEVELRRLIIDDLGGLVATFPIDRTGKKDVKAAMLALVDLVDLLEAAADAPALPLPEEGTAPLAAIGGASGAPVGIPGGPGDRAGR
ncbi:MAG: hypothetical protein FJ137_19870 [Deltaproteobacteria bacterium]|nr:hypothetical protein [Planctomycetota bacterium]MBM4282908.1 hypothetical protein [Deltaproteobacteria bacterium]